MDNYIGIDISLNSTCIYIESDKGKTILSFTNKKDNNVHIKALDQFGVKFFHIGVEKSKIYSENEILKIKHFDKLAIQIQNEISDSINFDKKTYCQIEGYSFSKNTSSILDIVSFSALIRTYLLKSIPNMDMTIISPSSLKLDACKLVYPAKDIGKRKPKLIYTNNDGIAGGSFKKPQMFQAMLDGNIDTPILGFLRENVELLERKAIPNPIEDIIDAIFACKVRIEEIKNPL